jgi:hypothetical protein
MGVGVMSRKRADHITSHICIYDVYPLRVDRSSRGVASIHLVVHM